MCSQELMHAQEAILGGVVQLIAVSSPLLRIGAELVVRHSGIQHLDGSQLTVRATATVRRTELATSVAAEDGVLASCEHESGFVEGEGRRKWLLDDSFAKGECVLELKVQIV